MMPPGPRVATAPVRDGSGFRPGSRACSGRGNPAERAAPAVMAPRLLLEHHYDSALQRFLRQEVAMRRRLYFVLPDLDSARRTADDLLLARIEHRHMYFLARR